MTSTTCNRITCPSLSLARFAAISMAFWWVSDKSTGTRIFWNIGVLSFFANQGCSTPHTISQEQGKGCARMAVAGIRGWPIVKPLLSHCMQLWKSELRHFATTQVILSRFHLGVERQDQPPSEGLMRFKAPPAAG